MKKRILPFIPVIIIVVLGVVLLGKRRDAMKNAPVAVPLSYTIRTAAPETGTVSQTSTFLAKLEAAHSATVSSKLSGLVTEVLVVENQQVQSGDLLIRIDSQEIMAGLATLQAKLLTAHKQYEYSVSILERNRDLFQAGGLSQEQLTASEIAFSGAEAAVQEVEQNIKSLENQLTYSNIRASFAGIVGTVLLRQGDLATPGRPLLTLNSLPQKLTFSFMVGAAEIMPGQDVRLRQTKIGTITRLYGDARNGLTVAELALDQRLDLANGSYLTIEVVTGRSTGCTVPVQALLHREQGVSVMIYREGHFVEQPVTVTVQGHNFAVVEPGITTPVAVAAEAKLSILPSFGEVRISAEGRHE